MSVLDHLGHPLRLLAPRGHASEQVRNDVGDAAPPVVREEWLRRTDGGTGEHGHWARL